MPQTEGEVVRNFVEIAARGGPRHRRGQHRAERDGVDADRQVDDAVHVVERRNRFGAEADRQRAVDEEADLQRGSADHAGQHKPPEPPENAAFAKGFARHGRKPSGFPEQQQHERKLNCAGDEDEDRKELEETDQLSSGQTAAESRVEAADQEKIQQQCAERGQHEDLPCVQHRADRADKADEERIRHQQRQDHERQLDAFAGQYRQEFLHGAGEGKAAQPERSSGDDRHHEGENQRKHRKDDAELAADLLRPGFCIGFGDERNQGGSERPLAEQPAERVRNRERKPPGARNRVAAEHARFKHDAHEPEHARQKRRGRYAERALENTVSAACVHVTSRRVSWRRAFRGRPAPCRS